MQGLLNLFDIYGERFLVVGVSLLSLTFVTLMFLWSYNRRRFMDYKHHIPARVMQGYLDSIIQNSSALKSSLLRGGGSDSVPFNLGNNSEGTLFRGGNNQNSDDDGSGNSAELAEVKAQLSEKETMISDLEEKMTEMLAKYREAEERANSTPAPVASGGDEATKLQLSEVTKERDLLKDKLKEYEFIENDLAEIPRLQRTVETLKATVKQLGVDPDEAVAGKAKIPAAQATKAPPVAASSPTTVATTTPAPANMDSAMSAIENAEKVATTPKATTEKKGDDDLLQQFEKMLG